MRPGKVFLNCLRLNCCCPNPLLKRLGPCKFLCFQAPYRGRPYPEAELLFLTCCLLLSPAVLASVCSFLWRFMMSSGDPVHQHLLCISLCLKHRAAASGRTLFLFSPESFSSGVYASSRCILTTSRQSILRHVNDGITLLRSEDQKNKATLQRYSWFVFLPEVCSRIYEHLEEEAPIWDWSWGSISITHRTQIPQGVFPSLTHWLWHRSYPTV